jgi:hypothetical protein
MKWFEIDKKRVLMEYIRVKNKYPIFELYIHGECLAWKGEVNLIPIDVESPPLKIRIIYSEGYPVVAPSVEPIEPSIPDSFRGHEWHRWMDGDICYVRPKYWILNYDAADIISKVETWYFNYLAYKSKLIDKMPEVGIADIPIKGGN